MRSHQQNMRLRDVTSIYPRGLPSPLRLDNSELKISHPAPPVHASADRMLQDRICQPKNDTRESPGVSINPMPAKKFIRRYSKLPDALPSHLTSSWFPESPFVRSRPCLAVMPSSAV